MPEVRGWCFDIQRYSVHDGPGIRTTIFLKGCPLSCPWCHNPEGISARPEIRIAESRCIHCGSCGEACPNGLAGGPVLPDPAACERCGRCADACPTGARQLVGWSLTAREAIDAAERDRPFYDEFRWGRLILRRRAVPPGAVPAGVPRGSAAAAAAHRRRDVRVRVGRGGHGRGAPHGPVPLRPEAA